LDRLILLMRNVQPNLTQFQGELFIRKLIRCLNFPEELIQCLHIYSNLMWPTDGGCYTGIICISVIVETDGNLTNKRIWRSIHKNADEEALKVINRMPKWIAGKCNGVKVPINLIIPIRWKLN
jgi:Gram-negative bacterial TonB protein C-terminal